MSRWRLVKAKVKVKAADQVMTLVLARSGTPEQRAPRLRYIACATDYAPIMFSAKIQEIIIRYHHLRARSQMTVPSPEFEPRSPAPTGSSFCWLPIRYGWRFTPPGTVDNTHS